MKGLLTVFVLSAVSLLATLGATAAPQQQGDPVPYCLGPTCVAEYTVFPLSGWTVSTNYHNNGQALDWDCEPCDGCSMKITYVYEGSYSVLVTYPGNASRLSEDWFYTTNVCDGIPVPEEFNNFDGQTKVASFEGILNCPCVPE